ncbi:centrosomal protein of 164 kDa isoform X2 [Cephus cinctus]|uniref:Centrosomal protein of 164 kDa isoform X2 n=1 Tax=Cephus cinctus TaxID=211228 RepID=A0AAJ7CA08_CEPCN|nr:centrosomal protein of 164 kDa isoform X2 [Cephus cinctus]
MSISQDSAATIVCREVFDEASHPSNEEVVDYAKRLGIDPDAEPHLLDLAQEGLMAALPKGWSPCFHEATGAWYYYQASTGTTTWEHPLDAVYKGLVEQARLGNRQISVEEDSKTTAKDLESHEEATLPKESAKTSLPTTKIPSKLVPLRKSKVDGPAMRKKDPIFEKHRSRKESEPRSENLSSISSDRASRDYTNLRFQDPKFYESPKLLDAPRQEFPRKELDLKEVLKRSESLSPRYEKDWEQLSSRFSSEENIIDIDKLSVASLTKVEKPQERFDKEKHPRQLGQQRELTLSGGGFMFLKSNRSRDTTPSQESVLLEDFQVFRKSDDTGNVTCEKPKSILREKPSEDAASLENLRILAGVTELSNAVGDRPKSILREKPSEDDDRHIDEERKSVRFDLEKEVDIKFTYSGSDDDWESESEEQNVHISAVITHKQNSEYQSILQRQNTWDFDSKTSADNEENGNRNLDSANKDGYMESSVNSAPKETKVVGRRFVVQNVSENEHFQQVTKSVVNDVENDFVSGKFENVKNIDLASKSETDSTARSSDGMRSLQLDDIRKSKEIMLENMKMSDRRMESEMQREKEEIYHLMKIRHDLEVAKHERKSKLKMENSKSIEDLKATAITEHDKEMESLKKEFAVQLERVKRELEGKFLEQKQLLEENIKVKLEDLREDMLDREKEEVEKLISEMDRVRLDNLSKVKAELEVCYEKEKQDILSNLKTELDQKRQELLELRKVEIEKLETEYERSLGEEKLAKLTQFELNKQHTEKIEALKKELEKEYDDLRANLRMQQREKIAKITEDHEKCLAEMLKDFRMSESLARKGYKQRLKDIRDDFSQDVEKEAKKQNERISRQETVDFEKIRCEKRLLEDKYKTLKEKYLKLKNDVRLAVERRNKKKEGNTTASETEKSTSARTRTDRTESSDQKDPIKKTHSISNSKPAEGLNQNMSGAEDSDGPKSLDFQKPIVYMKNAQKFESDDTTASETNSNLLKKKKTFTKKAASPSKLNNNLENPVENIRKQLEKLEDLGDQLPSNDTAYTLRYPFQDKAPATASAELKFFRHRIHVERDSVRRAREALRQQRSAFQGQQRAWKQRSAKSTLEQIVQEERELSDMEVSLHRTRSLLGEKVIHLRHLEQSLERVANAKKNENDSMATKNDELTLSDMSSASSGFSSTDVATDTFIDKPDHYQESTEIIASLENLNSEIREIWGVLNKRQDNNIPPPPTFMYSDLGWLPYQALSPQPNNVQAFGTPNIHSNILSQLTGTHPPITTTQNIIAQYGPNNGYTTSVGTVERTVSNLMERTRNLRDWLRQARVESTDLVSPGQATL